VAACGPPGRPLAVCAPNAFKGTLSAAAAARALAAGVADAGWSARQVPVADGGDGTLDVLLGAAGARARIQLVRAAGPLGRPRVARLGWIAPDVAVVELAEASGLRRMPAGLRDPLGSTSRGAGDLIVAALGGGARRIVVGLGGSASTDGGTGILAALGARLRDAGGQPVPPRGATLAEIDSVDLSAVDPRLRTCAIEVAVDVRSPLFGPEGAAHVFAPQKGADAAQVAALDSGLRHLAGLVERAAGRPGLATEPGSGAAGGAGFALAALGARLVGGAALVCDLVGLDGALAGASLVITGEGRLDAQTAAGKAPAEVALRAAAAGVPCVAVAGSADGGASDFAAVVTLDSFGPDPRRHVRALLRAGGERAARLAASSAAPGQP
jgi:glycerate 2-kinase